MLNSSSLAKNGYAATQTATSTPRAMEYQIFAQITSRISTAHKKDGPTAFAEFAQALHDNVRLWSILAIDAAGDGNQLAPALRAQIVSLAGFVRNETGRVLARENEPDTLIDVNTAIMRGLRGAVEEGS